MQLALKQNATYNQFYLLSCKIYLYFITLTHGRHVKLIYKYLYSTFYSLQFDTLCNIKLSIFRRCFHTAYYYLDDPPENPPPTLMNWDSQIDDGQGHTTVSIANFAKHTANLHADGDIGFSKEYDAIQSECTPEEYTSQISQLAENKSKNRYLNIIACK